MIINFSVNKINNYTLWMWAPACCLFYVHICRTQLRKKTHNIKFRKKGKSCHNFCDKRKNDIRKRQEGTQVLQQSHNSNTLTFLSVTNIMYSLFIHHSSYHLFLHCSHCLSLIQLVPSPLSQWPTQPLPPLLCQSPTHPLLPYLAIHQYNHFLPHSACTNKHNPSRTHLGTCSFYVYMWPLNSCTLCYFSPTLYEDGTNAQAKIERLVTVNTDLSRNVHIAGKLVSSSAVLRELPDYLSDINCLQNIMHCGESAYICPGSPQSRLVEIVDKRCSLGSKEVVDTDGCMHGRTIWTGDC